MEGAGVGPVVSRREGQEDAVDRTGNSRRNRRYWDREVEIRVREKLQRETEQWSETDRRRRRGVTRGRKDYLGRRAQDVKEGVSRSEGAGREGSQQWSGSMSGNRCKSSRWDSAVPTQFETPGGTDGQADKGEDGRELSS